jgi:ABC-type sugar transport system substrate-binding protein
MQLKILPILSRAITVLILLFLAACSGGIGSGSTTGSSSGTTPGNKNPADIHVGFVAETTSQNFSSEMVAGAQYAAHQFHVSAQIVAPPNINDPAALQLFEKLTKTARDGIAVETLSPELFTHAEAEAVHAGIPIIAVDNAASLGAGITTYIGNDNVAAGVMLAQAAIEHLPGDARGSVVIGIPIPGLSALTYRVQGIQEEFRRIRPDLEMIDPFNSQQAPQQNYTAWNTFLKAHPGAIVCLGVGDGDNASLASIKQNNHSTYLSAAFDLNEAGLQAVANGTNFALVDPEHFLKGYVAMRLLIEHALSGILIPRGWWNPGAQLVTQSNVQEIITRQESLAARASYYQPMIEKEFANSTALIKPIGQAK